MTEDQKKAAVDGKVATGREVPSGGSAASSDTFELTDNFCKKRLNPTDLKKQ